MTIARLKNFSPKSCLFLIETHCQTFIRVDFGFSDSQNLGSTVVLVLTFVLCASTLLHFVSLLPVFFVEVENYCEFYHRFSTTVAAISFGSAYFAIWLRVYVIFYRQPLIKDSLKKPVMILSKLAVVFIFIMIVFNLAMFLSAPAYETTPLGCLRVSDKGRSALKWGTLITSAAICLITLLFLFVYPLLLHRRKMLRQGFQSNKVMPIIKRAVIITIVIITSNLFTALYGIVVNEKYTYIRHLVYGINFIITLIALVCFNADWKDRFFPALHTAALKRQRTLRTSVSNFHKESINMKTVSGCNSHPKPQDSDNSNSNVTSESH